MANSEAFSMNWYEGVLIVVGIELLLCLAFIWKMKNLKFNISEILDID